MKYEEIRHAWNAQADEFNQWVELGLGEKVEWAARLGAAKERAARQAAQTEVADLKERIARAGVEQRRALYEALQQEREAFEKYMAGSNLRRTQFDDYENNYVHGKWEAWQARAALNAAPEDSIRTQQ